MARSSSNCPLSERGSSSGWTNMSDHPNVRAVPASTGSSVDGSLWGWATSDMPPNMGDPVAVRKPFPARSPRTSRYAVPGRPGPPPSQRGALSPGCGQASRGS